MAKMFDKNYLLSVFRKIGSSLNTKISVYVLGGGAMCFRSQKAGTKDLDLVFIDNEGARCFVGCARKEGFARPPSIGDVYQMMKTFDILEDANEFRLDIFSKSVCGALRLSKGMVARAEHFGTYGKLEIFLVSNEDLILFKGITERDRDADDISAIIRASPIDWNIVLQECISQSSTEPWYGLLADKFIFIKEKYGIAVPITDRILELDVVALIKNAFEIRMKKGMSRKDAIADLMEKGFTKKELDFLND